MGKQGYVTVPELARMLVVSEEAVRKRIRTGKLTPSAYNETRALFTTEAAMAIVAEGQHKRGRKTGSQAGKTMESNPMCEGCGRAMWKTGIRDGLQRYRCPMCKKVVQDTTLGGCVLDAALKAFEPIRGSLYFRVEADAESDILKVLQQMYAVGDVKLHELLLLQDVFPLTTPALRTMLGDSAMRDLEGHLEAARPRTVDFVPKLMAIVAEMLRTGDVGAKGSRV